MGRIHSCDSFRSPSHCVWVAAGSLQMASFEAPSSSAPADDAEEVRAMMASMMARAGGGAGLPPPVGAEPAPVALPLTRQGAARINGVHTEVVVSGFADRVVVVVSQLGKPGTLLSASAEPSSDGGRRCDGNARARGAAPDSLGI